MEQKIDDELTYKIIGAAMKVHNTLGCGFQPGRRAELIYQRCLAIEMKKQGLGFARELEIPIYYEEIEVGSRRVDFLVEEKVLVEIKAIVQLEAVRRCGCSSGARFKLFESVQPGKRFIVKLWKYPVRSEKVI